MGSEERLRTIIVILGAAGSGKTTLATKFVSRYPGEVKIVDPSGEFSSLGFENTIWPGRASMDDWIRELHADGAGPAGGGWGPGLLVLDDLDRYVPKGSNRENPWVDVWIANRHIGFDVLAISHRPASTPLDLIANASELWLFAQEEPNAIAYLSQVPALADLFADGRTPLPAEPYVALRYRKAEQSAERIRLAA